METDPRNGLRTAQMQAAPAHTLWLSIESRLDEVDLLGAVVDAACRHARLSDSARHDVELCLAEAVNNVILHGLRGEPGHHIDLALSVDGERLCLEIQDDGRPIPPEKLAAARRRVAEGDTPEELLATSGRGLPILYSLMDGVEYESQGGRNRLVLVQRR